MNEIAIKRFIRYLNCNKDNKVITQDEWDAIKNEIERTHKVDIKPVGTDGRMYVTIRKVLNRDNEAEEISHARKIEFMVESAADTILRREKAASRLDSGLYS